MFESSFAKIKEDNCNWIEDFGRGLETHCMNVGTEVSADGKIRFCPEHKERAARLYPVAYPEWKLVN